MWFSVDATNKEVFYDLYINKMDGFHSSVPSHDVPMSDQSRLGLVSVKALMHKFVF
jgi:hypothetical protein